MIDLDLQRKSLPDEPGVYLFKDKKGKIIYVGKAKNLKKRVSSYFLKTTYNDPYYEDKIRELVKNMRAIDYIVTENEKEAYILENIQIKKHLPRFNVFMRDSKSYPWVCLFYSEDYPRIKVIRGPEKYSDGNILLGPYTDKKEIQWILRDLRKIFPYCSCKNPVKKRTRPCLNYQIKLCPGPCIDAISKEDYRENIRQIELFLKGETNALQKKIENKMLKASQEQNYEQAAFWRDKLKAIENSTTTQNVLLDHDANKDIIGYFSNDDYAAMVIIQIRDGRISNKNSFQFDLREKLILKEEILSSILEQYYQDLIFQLPDVIVIPELHEGIQVLKEILEDRNEDIMIRTPLEEEEGLLRIANKNAKVIVNQQVRMDEIMRKEGRKILEEAKEILNLPNVPRIIEGFDISNTEGINAVGSLVYFLEGKPYNKNYRSFNIRAKSTPDDIGMMKEAIKRRYSNLLKNKEELPDLILVDGGKGQLNAGISVLKELGLEIPIIGLAKKAEEIFTPGKKNPIILSQKSNALKLFQQVRDEAHRFAIKLHKKQRAKRLISSVLDDIKGVGPATRNKLLTHFGSVESIKKATLEELSQVVGKKIAENIAKELKNL